MNQNNALQLQKTSQHQYEDQESVSSSNIHHDDHPEQYSHGDNMPTQVNHLCYSTHQKNIFI